VTSPSPGTPGPETLWGLLAWHAAEHPRRPFVVTDGDGRRDLTYGDVLREAEAMAAVWSSVGVGAGDRVHVQLGNVPEFVVGLFAAARLGAALVPTALSATVDDVVYVTSHAGCTLSLVARERADVVNAAAEMVPDLAHVIPVGDGGGVDVIALHPPAAPAGAPRPPAAVRSGDVAAVLYTSGTTGWPKGVMITHANMLFAGQAVAELVRLRSDDRWLVTLPLSHANALLYSTMSAFVTGASVALVERFDPADWSAAAHRTGATVASLFAVHARRLLALPPRRSDRAAHLRLTLFAQHLPAAERTELDRRFDTHWVQVYGLTETLAPSLSDPVSGPVRADSVGRPTSWVQARVVGVDGREVPDGTVGELQVRGVPGHTLMAGYLGRPADTAAATVDGWFATGDRMCRLDDGSFAFYGRREEILKPGVDNVSTAEIERVLVEHVSVADAAVVGLQHDDGQESIVAFLVLRPGDDATTEEVRAWAGERLTEHKVPHSFVVVEELPRNSVGKVLKGELRTRAGALVVAH
jgi:carnitine-CoA ligase